MHLIHLIHIVQYTILCLVVLQLASHPDNCHFTSRAHSITKNTRGLVIALIHHALNANAKQNYKPLS